MDYRKATCLYHPNQTITNFCRDSILSSIEEIALCPCAQAASVIILSITNKIKPNLPTLIYLRHSTMFKTAYIIQFAVFSRIEKEI